VVGSSGGGGRRSDEDDVDHVDDVSRECEPTNVTAGLEDSSTGAISPANSGYDPEGDGILPIGEKHGDVGGGGGRHRDPNGGTGVVLGDRSNTDANDTPKVGDSKGKSYIISCPVDFFCVSSGCAKIARRVIIYIYFSGSIPPRRPSFHGPYEGVIGHHRRYQTSNQVGAEEEEARRIAIER
jgi:hypothetical protein